MNHQIPIIHPDFRFNGFPHTKDTLNDAAYSLIKEGEPYERAIGDFLMDWLNEEETIPIKTSGTTGMPKTMSASKAHMIASARLTGSYFKLEPGYSCLLALSASYIAGKMMLVRALVLGLHLEYVEPTASPIPYSKTFDFTALVPMQVKGSVKQLEQVKTILIGGAPLLPDLFEPILNSASDIYETYGMAETLTHVAVRRLNHTLSGAAEHVFTALPGVAFSMDDRHCLVIDAEHLELHGWVTNDVVEWVSDSEFVWKGRIDHMINTGGVNVHPEDLEARLRLETGKEVMVSAVPDARLGQKIIAIIEGNENTQNIEKQILELDDLHFYEKPKIWYSIPRFERNASGKVDRIKTLKLLDI